MWDFFETVRHRHSVRQYQQDMPVDEGKLHAILEMACAAPSAGDLQAYQIIVVQDAQIRAHIGAAAGAQSFIAQAPVCLVFCSAPSRSSAQFGARGEQLFSLQDATIAASYAQLAVVAAGMGSTWIGDFDEAKIRQLLQLDAGLTAVAMLSIGYTAELPEPTPRRSMKEVVRYL